MRAGYLPKAALFLFSFAQSHPSEKVVRLLNQYFFVHPLQYANVTPLAQQQMIPPTLFFIPSTAGTLLHPRC
jgi:hypothetical protein